MTNRIEKSSKEYINRIHYCDMIDGEAYEFVGYIAISNEYGDDDIYHDHWGFVVGSKYIADRNTECSVRKGYIPLKILKESWGAIFKKPERIHFEVGKKYLWRGQHEVFLVGYDSLGDPVLQYTDHESNSGYGEDDKRFDIIEVDICDIEEHLTPIKTAEEKAVEYFRENISDDVLVTNLPYDVEKEIGRIMVKYAENVNEIK